jgi:hypothetical protein
MLHMMDEELLEAVHAAIFGSNHILMRHLPLIEALGYFRV